MGTMPWRDPERYVSNSPLFFADRVSTPIMLIHGDLDTMGTIYQTEEMFTALHRENKDAMLVTYMGEVHTVEHPQNQRDMWKRIFSFLEWSSP